MKKTMFAAALALSFGALAHAADGKYQVGLGLFDSIPTSDFGDYFKSSLGFNVSGDYKISDMFSAGVEIGDALGYKWKEDTNNKYMILTYGVRGKIVKSMDFGSKKGDVYGIVGISNYSLTTSPDVGGETKIGYSFGAGAQMEIAPQWLVGLEVRYHLLKVHEVDLNTIAPALTVGYSF